MHERDVPLAVFERVAVPEHNVRKALRELVGGPNVAEAVVLSTCLRTEVYAVVERFHDGLSDIESFFRQRLGAGEPVTSAVESREHGPEVGGGIMDLGEPLVCRYDEAAVAYLFDVAAGIDSPVLGEGEILRQVRAAAETARLEHAIGTVLDPLFRHAVEAGKRARAETAIARGTTSLAHAAVELAADHAGGLENKKILVVGAGEMGAGIARALAGRGDLTGEVVVANRGADRAAEVADLMAARAVDLDSIPGELAGSDVVLTSTAADGIVLPLSMFAGALSGGRRVVVVDMAVPRDVDPAVGLLEGVTRLDVEDIRRHAEQQMSTRLAEVPLVRALLAEELDRYRASAAARLAAPIVAALRDRVETIRAAELERHSAGLSASEREVVETVTRRVVAKLLHEPTVRVKEVAGSPRGERLAEALRVLFDL